MYIQNYLLCILYLILVILHLFTLCREEFHRSLISVFSTALLGETIWTTLIASHQIVEQYGNDFENLPSLITMNSDKFQYNAQFIHIVSMNFFILFLLIVAKGWPITRRDMPFKYAFAIFWLFCISADLTSFYWTSISSDLSSVPNVSQENPNNSSQEASNSSISTSMKPLLKTTADATATGSTIDEELHDFQSNFNSMQHKFSLLLRILIMVYFLLELRTTMIIEQEKKNLQFYLNFGASTMVWLCHTLIVYFISLRVDSKWRQELISGCSSAANFIGFAATTRLLWPWNPRSQLFRRRAVHSCAPDSGCSVGGGQLDNYLTIIQTEDAERNYLEEHSEEYDGLEMRDLSRYTGEQRNS